MATILGSGKATIARITAERFGCKDEALLQLIEKLAAADIVVNGKPEFCAGSPEFGDGKPRYILRGTMDAKPFLVTLTGPAVEDFA
jgi:hypothetical protein